MNPVDCYLDQGSGRLSIDVYQLLHESSFNDIDTIIRDYRSRDRRWKVLNHVVSSIVYLLNLIDGVTPARMDLSVFWLTLQRLQRRVTADEIDDESKDAFNRSSIVNYQFLRPWDLLV